MVLEGYVTPDGVWAEYEAHDYDQAAADALNVYETQFLPRYKRKTQVAPSIGSKATIIPWLLPRTVRCLSKVCDCEGGIPA